MARQDPRNIFACLVAISERRRLACRALQLGARCSTMFATLTMIERAGDVSTLSVPLIETDEGPAPMLSNTIFVAAAQLVARPLLSVSTPDELEEALEAAGSDIEVAGAYRLLVEVLSQELKGFEPQAKLRPQVLRTLGAQASASLEKGLPCILAAADASAQIAAQLPVESSHEGPDRPLDWFVTERDIPVPVARCLLAALRGSLASVALGLAAASGEALSAWLAVSIADLIIGGAREYLRFAGALPVVELSPEVLPKDRLDLDSIMQEHREGVWGLRLAALRHRASRREVTRLLGDVVPYDEPA